ncbi:MAG: HAMP domain-containing histidine kinase [Planctomycetaceae bacterium]|nr:HAMP domain-containing histidine kinase [Planctomycetales bacterium]MCB9927697.1 HAMP domain-containing histidine kinase [Planctomycetaceae bacterium]
MPVPADAREIDRLEVNASWLLRLRWVAVVGQLLTIAVARFAIQVDLETLSLLVVVGFTAISNVAFAYWLRTHTQLPEQVRVRRDPWVLAAVMGVDLLSLTTLLFLSGGPANPFTIFFFVNLALAAVVLPTRSSWCLLLLAIGCLGILLVIHVPVPALSRPVILGATLQLTLQQIGLVVGVALCAGVAIYFITRVTRELQEREADLRQVELQRARSDRLEALATLAAGAGHELASPLSTIAVIAKDLQLHLDGTDVPDTVLDDIGLIRSELDHCRKILDGMASGAGQSLAEEMLPVTGAQLLEETLEGLSRRDRVELKHGETSAKQPIVVPLTGMANALRGLIRNGLDASNAEEVVEVSTQTLGDSIVITIEDRGCGMTPAVLSRAGEPFFTTKEPGQGMGLGLFLTQNLLRRLGGSLTLDSSPGVGTKSIVRLPIARCEG